ncbi:FimB/Mfa2 family fimbrial subunit [Bacteroides caecigallinarum]|uniref:FimB/Mfa2 family fimbrial subunit n=1 Tax=Bacteroides caecigallinarum TaxID=1411144 RepID=UPI0019589FAB|nr:FimB/Mfa2 family fimbrial subunit [Bacteroides caecigallinarum]MBM6890122.1 FimB/Mfa2 family fimbrial subunit [Bacteroides caecigallinarum]
MKTRKRKYTTTILATALLFSLGGCVKDELHDTPHPDKGIVAVSIDLPQGASGEDYTVEIDGTTADGKEGRYTVSDPLPPGEYTVLAYNTPQGFTVTDGIARVERTDGTVRALTDFINPLPDYLYSGTERITVMADDTLRMNLDVTQRVRDLHIELTVTEGDPERITGITGTLSGVAEAYDLRNETLYGEAVSTRPTFTRDGDKVSADLRLLGVLGDAQTLTLVLTFTDGQTQTVESDLTEVLSGFGEGDMTQTFAIEGGLRTPLEAGFSATITDWEVVDEGKIDVN